MVIRNWYQQEISQPVPVRHLNNGNMFTHNENGNVLGVYLFDNGVPYTITGTVTGYAVLPNGGTVPCVGEKSGNGAFVTIPAAAYQNGHILVSVFISEGTHVTTVLAVDVNVVLTRTNSQVDPGTVIDDWTDTINAAMQAVEAAASNIAGIVATPYASLTFPVPLGKYMTRSGNLYRCIVAIPESETYTASHWQQVRIGDDLYTLDNSVVKYTGAQSLTSSQKAQARTNIGAADAAKAVSVESQEFSSGQKAQARTNIGAADAAKAVSVESQSFDESQKLQARTNIGAASSDIETVVNSVVIPTPDDKIVFDLKTPVTAKDKYVYRQSSSGQVRQATKANVGYSILSLSELEYGLGVYYNNLSALATELNAAVMYVADGNTVGSNSLVAITGDRIQSGYYSYVTWDSVSKTAVLDKAALLSEIPTASAIFVDYYNTDIVRPIKYYSDKSTNEKLADLKTYTDNEIRDKSYYPDMNYIPGVQISGFTTGKYAYKRASDATVRTGNDNSWSYKCLSLSASGEYIALNLDDIDNYAQVVFILADGGDVGANVIITMTKTNVTTRTYKYMDYDPDNDRIILNLSLLSQMYPTATHIFVNAYSTDYYCDVNYYNEESVDTRLERINYRYYPYMTYVRGDKIPDFVDGKFAYKRASDATVRTGNDDNWHYKTLKLSDLGEYVALEFRDIENYTQALFLIADGGDVAANVIVMMSQANATTRTYSYMDYDATNHRIIIKPRAIEELYDTATHIFVNAYSTDFYCDVSYYDTKSVEYQLDRLNEAINTIPEDYFAAEHEAVKKAILAKSDSPCLALTVVTDTHYNPDDTENTRRTNDTLNNVLEMNKDVFTDAVVHLGDIFGGRDIDHTQVQVDNGLSYIQRRLSSANDRVYIVEGNHDGVDGMPALTQNYASLSKMNEAYVVREGDNPYFYVDIEKPKLRLIFLVTTRYYDINGTTYNYWGIDPEQLTWFGQTALDVDNGRDIIIFSHMGTYHTNFTHNKISVCGLCNAFNVHSTYQVYDGETLLYTADFTTKTLSKILFWHCGHAHFDWVVPTSFSGLNFPQIVTTCSLMFQANVDETYAAAGASSPARTDYDVTQDAWDTVVYRPDEHKVYFIRFGAGSDRTINLSTWDITQ